MTQGPWGRRWKSSLLHVSRWLILISGGRTDDADANRNASTCEESTKRARQVDKLQGNWSSCGMSSQSGQPARLTFSIQIIPDRCSQRSAEGGSALGSSRTSGEHTDTGTNACICGFLGTPPSLWFLSLTHITPFQCSINYFNRPIIIILISLSQSVLPQSLPRFRHTDIHFLNWWPTLWLGTSILITSPSPTLIPLFVLISTGFFYKQAYCFK